MATPKNGKGRGGARANSGRKPKEAKAAIKDFNAQAQDIIAPWLPGLLANLKRLADGGYERVEETFEASEVTGLMECVKRTVEVAEPDRLANEYLTNRLLGKPTERQEIGPIDGEQVPVEFDVAMKVVWDDEEAA